MTQLFDSNGDVRPATVIQAGPCVVTQRKTASKDGYDAAQIGLVEFVKESKLNKAELGHLTKNNLPPVRIHSRSRNRSRSSGSATAMARARRLAIACWSISSTARSSSISRASAKAADSQA